jgi:hypothetical protein
MFSGEHQGHALMRGRRQMADNDLDAMQAAYKTAIETWIAAIREEETLASVPHNVAEIDLWEAAHFREDQRRTVLAAKRAYEDALRRKYFNF